MKILNYHPSVSAYVATDYGYYDLSEDITNCTVRRLTDAPSEFTLRVQNPAHKYDMKISPMDRITILAQKDDEQVRLLTGYVTTVDRFKLYENDLLISGKDTLYRIQNLYFDPHLYSVISLFSHSSTFDPNWGGYASDIYRWLTSIGGWNENEVDIGVIPEHVVAWARDLYKKQLEDIKGAITMGEEFSELLRNTGSVSGGAVASGVIGGDSGGTIVDGNLSVNQQRVIAATKKVGFQGTGWCAKWVSCVFSSVFGDYPGGNANDMCDSWCKYTDRSQLKPGMIVACHPSGATGNYYGHVGIYVGDNIIRHNSSYVQDSTVDSWINTYGPSGAHHGGTVRWGWVWNKALV